jgi:tetratricopeptide (TPR) repeat protein
MPRPNPQKHRTGSLRPGNQARTGRLSGDFRLCFRGLWDRYRSCLLGLAFSGAVLLQPPGNTEAQGPSTKAPGFREVPPIETKVKQVPGDGSYSVPLWKQHWERGRKYVFEKEYGSAVTAYKQALALKPNLDEARLELVRLLETLQRYEEASRELELFVEHQPNQIKVQQELGDLFLLRKEYRRAAEWYQRVLLKEPENQKVRLSLAGAFYQIGEMEKALLEWRQVLIRDPQHLEARINLAEGLRVTRRLDEAISILEGLVKSVPKQPGIKKKLAQALAAAQRNKEALPYLQELNRSDPNDLEVQLLLARTLAAGKNYDQSLPYLETYLKKKPENPTALLEKARILLNQGQVNQALDIFQQIRKLFPDDVEIQQEIAEAFFAAGKYPEALAEFQVLGRRLPDNFQVQEKLGYLYLQTKHYPQAVAAYEALLSQEPNYFYGQLGLARAYNLSGQKEKAVLYYQRLLKNRENPEIELELASLLIEMQHFKEALEIYEGLLRENPNLWEVRYRYATALYGLKEFRLANGQLEKLIQDQPNHSGVWTLLGYNALEWGNYREAQQAFQKVILLGEDVGNILIRLGEVFRLRGRPFKGANYLDWALTLKPDDQEILIQKALAFIEGGNYSQARNLIRPLLFKNPHSLTLNRVQGRWLMALERNEEFEHLSRHLEQAFPAEQALVFQDRADYFERKKKPGLALTALRAAQFKKPDDLQVLRKLGQVLIENQQWTEAESFYQGLITEKVLVDEAHLRLARIKRHQGRPLQAIEHLWKALAQDPNSIEARFWLWRLQSQKGEGGSVSKIEENLWEFARSQEKGLLELAQQLAAEKQWEPALAVLREIIEKGEDDEVLVAALITADYRLSQEEYENAQIFLDAVQKRFPRNQKITRKLIQAYSLNKSLGEAIKAIDGLLKIEDPQDPVLNIRKARLLEKWNKHLASQRTYASLLAPPVDQLLREKIHQERWPEVISGAEPLKALLEEPPTQTIYRFYEEWVKGLETASLDSGLQTRIRDFVVGLQARALIQKKVFLEMEGKDRLHRGQYLPARDILLDLKFLDPENEEVDSDLERSYLLQPLS